MPPLRSTVHQARRPIKTRPSHALLASACLLVSTLALGQPAGPCAALAQPNAGGSQSAAAARETIYVRDFTPVSQETGGSRLLPSRLRAARNSVKVDQNASALAEGVVQALNAKGIPACHLAGQALPPPLGWLVTGEFEETLSSGFHPSLPSMSSSKQDTPNTQIFIQLANLAGGAGEPGAAIATSGALKGQGSAAAPKPYGAAARFVINKTEAISSLDALAGSIAEQIAIRKAALDNAGSGQPGQQ
jgi:hypothetical protein